jgi:hypothetical protein
VAEEVKISHLLGAQTVGGKSTVLKSRMGMGAQPKFRARRKGVGALKQKTLQPQLSRTWPRADLTPSSMDSGALFPPTGPLSLAWSGTSGS